MRLLQVQNAATGKQSERLESISSKLDVQTQASWEILRSVASVFSAIRQVKQMLAQVADNVVHLQTLASNAVLLRPLDPTRELPIILEDTLGKKFRITPE